LQTTDLQLLKILFQPREQVRKILEKLLQHNVEQAFNIKEELRKLLDIDQLVFQRSISRLRDKGVIDDSHSSTIWSDARYSKQFLEDAIGRVTGDLQRLVTDFGKNFVKYHSLFN